MFAVVAAHVDLSMSCAAPLEGRDHDCRYHMTNFFHTPIEL